jgi:hypothetical protein
VFLERESVAGLRKEARLTSGSTALATQRRRKAWQRASWAGSLVQPKAGNDARARKQRAAGEKELGFRAESEEKEEFCFLFSFSIISKHFQMILKPNLNLNQTTHLKNLNAIA